MYDNARKLNKEGEVWHAELVDPDTKTTFPITMEIERKNRKQDIFKCSYRAFKSGIYRISLRVEHSHGKSSHALLPELITVLPGLTSGAPCRGLAVLHKARGQRPFTVARLDSALTQQNTVAHRGQAAHDHLRVNVMNRAAVLANMTLPVIVLRDLQGNRPAAKVTKLH